MSTKYIAEMLSRQAEELREKTRQLNLKCSNLNGVAAKVPDGTPYPLGAFVGQKIILHNVSYDHAAGVVAATVTIPYGGGGDQRYAGNHYRYFITENWFND